MKKKHLKIIALVILVLVMIPLAVTTCVSNDNSYHYFNQAFRKLFNYKTEFTCTFESESDIEHFEKGLEALNIEILFSEKDEKQKKYHVNSHYKLEDDILPVLKDTYSAAIVDLDGNIVATNNDVIKVVYDGVVMEVYVSDDFCNTYSLYDIYDMDIMLDGVIYNTHPGLIRIEDGNYIQFVILSDVPRELLAKSALGFSSYNLEGEIVIEKID